MMNFAEGKKDVDPLCLNLLRNCKFEVVKSSAFVSKGPGKLFLKLPLGVRFTRLQQPPFACFQYFEKFDWQWCNINSLFYSSTLHR